MTKRLLPVVAVVIVGSVGVFGQTAGPGYPTADPMANISVELTRVRAAVTTLSKSMIDFVDKFEKVGGVTINEKQQKLIVAMEVLQRAEARLAGLQAAQVLQVEKLNETRSKLAQNEVDSRPRNIDRSFAMEGTTELVELRENKIALSDDSQTIYVGLDGAAAVRRVDVASHTATTQFRLGSDQFSGIPFTVGALAVMPGDPNAVAVARLNTTSTPGAGVAVYDNGVQRPNIATNPSDNATYLAFGATAATLYGSQQFGGGVKKMSVDAGGVTSVGVTSFTFAKDTVRERAPYNERGQVHNPTTDMSQNLRERGLWSVRGGRGRRSGILPVNAQTHSDPVILRAYDVNTFAPVGEVSIGGVFGTNESRLGHKWTCVPDEWRPALSNPDRAHSLARTDTGPDAHAFADTITFAYT
jgi:hypothetical protein